MGSRMIRLELLTNGVHTEGGLIRQRSTGPSRGGFFPNAIHSDVQHDPDSKLKVDPGHSQFKFGKCSLDLPLHEFLYFNVILRD